MRMGLQRRGLGKALQSRARRERAAGQSVAEFALVLPVMLLILVAVADFSRVFTAIITVEAATRDAAEAGAQEYLRTIEDPLPDPGDPNYYRALHQRVAKVACAEMRSLPNTDYDPGTGTCAPWPVVRVCVHDGVADNQCGNPIAGFNTNDTACPRAADPMVPARAGGIESSRYVEVRLCYRFSMLLRLPALPFGAAGPTGDIVIERSRMFTVADY